MGFFSKLTGKDYNNYNNQNGTCLTDGSILDGYDNYAHKNQNIIDDEDDEFRLQYSSMPPE